MSNNKSRQLARIAGGHKVFLPKSGFVISVAERKRRVDFVKLATGVQNINTVVSDFCEILRTYRRDPSVVDIVSQRTGLSKRLTVSQLFFYCNEYRGEEEIRRLLVDEW
jgi:VanZ family protein